MRTGDFGTFGELEENRELADAVPQARDGALSGFEQHVSSVR